SFKIFAGDEITDLIKKTDDGVISFSLADESALADVRLHIKSHESETWVPLDAQCRGTVYTAPVPQDWAEGFTSLKITAQDIHENILEYIVNPAFHFGDSVQTIIAPDSAATISDSPKVFSLGQNYPNPFNPVTTIRYCIPEKSSVILAVYDILGRQAALLVDEEKPAGDHKIQFDGRNLASGVYIYVLQAGDFCAQKKSILLR
ncbi:T9SS type A sorting domain-containing protein, partial [candidate division KSB1 bacterium]